MEQTKYLEVLSPTRLGKHFNRILSAYAESVGHSGCGVPREIIGAATQIDERHLPQAREGPADAVDGATTALETDFSSAVIDTGLEEVTPLQLWSVAMTKYQVLEECRAVLEALGADPSSDVKEQTLKKETRAIADAAQALRRLAALAQERDAKKRFASFMGIPEVEGFGYDGAARLGPQQQSNTPHEVAGSRCR